MKNFYSVSWGKDSLAMVLKALELGNQVDEILFYDTGMEFDAIYKTMEKFNAEHPSIPIRVLKPKEPFLYTLLEKPVYSKKKGFHFGYGWCGGNCRWGTTGKLLALDKICESVNCICNIGIAVDEVDRLSKEIKNYKKHPLVNYNMTEKDCLKYCYNHGYYWMENGIRLYDVLDRVSCWCCCNKNKKELYNIFKYLPKYWEKLLFLQSKIDRPFKNYSNKKIGFYGDLISLDKYFKSLEV